MGRGRGSADGIALRPRGWPLPRLLSARRGESSIALRLVPAHPAGAPSGLA